MCKKINEEQKSKEKIVNLFEDCGNFHDEKKLQKSYEKVAETDKNQK